MKLPFLQRHPRVAVLRLSGLIAARTGGFAPAGISAQAMAPLIERAFAIRRLSAVVLIINSPGGSPVQSSLVAQRIRRLADEKKVPVIAFVEDAAASGGYWLACAADEIVADPASILGSIGVISAGFDLSGAIGRVGIARRLHTAGEEKSFLDPFRPERPEDLDRLQDLLAELHETFKDWVRTRRAGKLKAEESHLFTGRFWTGGRRWSSAWRMGWARRPPASGRGSGRRCRSSPSASAASPGSRACCRGCRRTPWSRRPRNARHGRV